MTSPNQFPATVADFNLNPLARTGIPRNSRLMLHCRKLSRYRPTVNASLKLLAMINGASLSD